MSGLYKQNAALMQKYAKNKEFDIRAGGFVKPSCCTFLINLIQLALTYLSILEYKGSSEMYWLP